MDYSVMTAALVGVVPATCDAEAGEAVRLATDVPPGEFAPYDFRRDDASSPGRDLALLGLPSNL